MSKKGAVNLEGTRLFNLVQEVEAEAGKELLTAARAVEGLVAEVKNFLTTTIRIEQSERLAYRKEELPDILGISRARMHRLFAEGQGPKQRKVKASGGNNAVPIVLKQDILEWLTALPER